MKLYTVACVACGTNKAGGPMGQIGPTVVFADSPEEAEKNVRKHVEIENPASEGWSDYFVVAQEIPQWIIKKAAQ